MPSGKIHYREWKRCWPHSLWGAAFMGVVNLWAGLGFFLGYLIGRFIEPDLDHRNITNSEYRAMKVFGPFGALFVAYWTLYGYLIPHRSPLSHYPIIGTIIRILYQFWWLPIVWIKLGYSWDNILLLFVGLFYGLLLSDLVHFFLDYGYLEYKDE